MKAPGFVNLRGTATASTNEDSVWPSFTDVMMVIVMVFLMALVVILIRNVDLTDQLDKTERRVELDSAQKTALEMNIAGLGDEVVGLRLQLGQVTRRAELAQLATADRDQQIGRLVQGVASLEQARDRLVRDNETLVGREGALQAELLSLEQTQQALLALRGELEAEVTRLDKEKAGVEKEGRALSEMLTTVTRERDVLLEDTAQLVKKQSALRIEKESMAAQLTETRQQQEGGAADIVRLRRQIVERDEKEQALAGERKVAQNVIERLEKTRTRMLQQAATLRAENAQLASDYLEAQRIQREMRKDIVGYSKKLDVAEGVQRTSVHALAARKARYAKEITALQAEQRALVDELKGQYSALQVKYDRLVRPARTFLGKHVVRIGYWKEGGIFRYSLREPGDLQARNINEQQLHRSLTALKSVYGKRLYTKILFPREAALSQKDAWRFTHQILRQYDYYSQ